MQYDIIWRGEQMEQMESIQVGRPALDLSLQLQPVVFFEAVVGKMD